MAAALHRILLFRVQGFGFGGFQGFGFGDWGLGCGCTGCVVCAARACSRIMCASMRRARALLSPRVPSIRCVLYRKRTHAIHARSACAPARVQRARREQQLQLPYSASSRVVSAAPVGRGRVGQCACMHTHSPCAPALGARPRSGRQGSRQRRRGRCTAHTTRLPLRPDDRLASCHLRCAIAHLPTSNGPM